MNRGAPLVLTYHAIDRGPSPLCIHPRLFEAHLSVLAAAKLRPLTVSALGEALASGQLPERSVVLTFDDAFASVSDRAAALLTRRRWTATVYAVADHLGGHNDWPSQPSGVPRRPLMTAQQLTELAALGWEIGSHAMTHPPLSSMPADAAVREITRSQVELQSSLGVPVTSFAYPYGVTPGPVGLSSVRGCYATACTGMIGRVSADTDLHLLPRVDAHYLRSPTLLRRVIEANLDIYLRGRRVMARLRRLARSDYVTPPR